MSEVLKNQPLTLSALLGSSKALDYCFVAFIVYFGAVSIARMWSKGRDWQIPLFIVTFPVIILLSEDVNRLLARYFDVFISMSVFIVFNILLFAYALVVFPYRLGLEKRLMWLSRLRKCPRCASLVPAEAVVCMHCLFDFEVDKSGACEAGADMSDRSLQAQSASRKLP